MEYAKEGELCNHIEEQDKLSEFEACKYFQQLISAVEYLHLIGCAHRDIKPSNILLDEEMNLKLIDFGLGNLYSDDETLKTACGSPCYAAPEIISGERYDPITVDIWSSGITLFAMICGFLPFDEESKSVLYKKILSCDYSIPSHVSSSAVDLLRRILVRNPQRRYTIKDIKKHPWFNLFKPNQCVPGIFSDKTIFPVDQTIAMITSKRMNIGSGHVAKMVQYHEQNKYTTLYYLLVKKKDKGDSQLLKEISEFEEKLKSKEKQIQISKKASENVEKGLFRANVDDQFLKEQTLRETVPKIDQNNTRDGPKKRQLINPRNAQISQKSQIKQIKQPERNNSNSNSNNLPVKQQNRSYSRTSSYSRERARNRTIKTFAPPPNLDIDVGDITYEIKEKITIKTTQDKKSINFDDFTASKAHKTSRSKFTKKNQPPLDKVIE